MIYVLSGGQTGATLTVTSSGAGTITVSNTTLGKSYSKSVTAGSSVVFKGLQTGTWTVTLTDGTQTSTKTVVITSDYSTNIAYFSATISITYPATSTCVVTDSGGQTVASNSNTGTSAKTWTATVNATGTYTVTATATDGSGNTKSETVEITTEGQFESVELSYNLVLFADGVLDSKYTLAVGTIANGVLNGATSGSKSIAIKPAVDVTNYSTLTVEFGTMSGDGYVTFGLRDTYSAGYDGYEGNGYAVFIGGTAYNSGPSVFSNKTRKLDLSKITGEKYVKLSLNLVGSQTCQIKSIIFE